MAKVAKGTLTRKLILDTARGIFNAKGINLTLDNLASEMDVPKGRITNHFSTKDKLFLAILDDYEEKLANRIRELYQHYTSQSMESVAFVLSELMDLQFEYRCSIIFLNVLSPGHSELREHIQVNAKRNIDSIRARMGYMVKAKLLTGDILDENNFQSFIFIYINQLTQWVVYCDMYDSEKGYKAVKPLYVRGIMLHVYGPYLTAKGKKELKNLFK